ncbi:MAG: hypothetical protein P8Y97_14205 [Candidatus Lokiarchaeota archaeon]
MVNLNRLTIPYIKKLAKECNIDLRSGRKAELIEQIESANIPETKLENLIKRYLNEKRKNKIKRKKKQLNLFQLEQRVDDLERKLDLLLNKFSPVYTEKNLVPTKERLFHTKKLKRSLDNEKQKNSELTLQSPTNLDAIKEFISEYLNHGDKIKVDDLFKIDQLQKIPLTLITKAITQLIEEDILNVSEEGNSIQKIDGTISILIRK